MAEYTIFTFSHEEVTYYVRYDDSIDAVVLSDSINSANPVVPQGVFPYTGLVEQVNGLSFIGIDSPPYAEKYVAPGGDDGGPSHPADGTFIRNQCYGFDLYQVVADGNGGERQGALVQANSKQCGYTPPPKAGCNDPAAENFDPEATDNDGTCTYNPEYYPVGGVLPNPIPFTVTVDPLIDGVPKRNHFLEVLLYRHGAIEPFASSKVRVRNGQARFDVSAFLKSEVKAELTATLDNVIVQQGSVIRFLVSYREVYIGSEEEEVFLHRPPRYAVNAAMPGYNDTMNAYLVHI